jgi:taurine dioxygenase
MPEGAAVTAGIAIRPTGRTLGATVEGVDLNRSLDAGTFAQVLRALGEHGVLRFPRQRLDPAQQMAFSAQFGSLEINVAGAFQEPGYPEIMILSNMTEPNGRPIGAKDAGQDWHTDMSYSETIAFANVLYAIKVPHRGGRPLGGTEFANMHAAYDGLPDGLKTRLDGMTVLHDFNKFWDMMLKRPGSWRKPLTQEQRDKKPPVSHPIFLTHPITGRRVLYANPGYAIRINELTEAKSDEVLEFLFELPAAGQVPLCPPLERRRCAAVGRHWHPAQRPRRLRPRRAPADQALPGDGRPDFRSRFRAGGARRLALPRQAGAHLSTARAAAAWVSAFEPVKELF